MASPYASDASSSNMNGPATPYASSFNMNGPATPENNKRNADSSNITPNTARRGDLGRNVSTTGEITKRKGGRPSKPKNVSPVTPKAPRGRPQSPTLWALPSPSQPPVDGRRASSLPPQRAISPFHQIQSSPSERSGGYALLSNSSSQFEPLSSPTPNTARGGHRAHFGAPISPTLPSTRGGRSGRGIVRGGALGRAANSLLRATQAENNPSSSPQRPPHHLAEEDDIDDMSDLSLSTRMKWITACLKKAGFARVDDLIVQYITEDFSKLSDTQTSTQMSILQYDFWNRGFPNILEKLDEQHNEKKRSNPWKRQTATLNEVLVSTATMIFRRESRRFARGLDNRGRNPETGQKNKVGDPGYGSRPPCWLQLQAKDVTSEEVMADIMGESIVQFKDNIPLLWNLIRDLTYNEDHEYERVKVDKDGNYIPADLDDDEHITTFIIHVMFNKYSSALRRFQIQIGLALYGAGSKEKTITTLAQYGVSIGITAIDSILEELAKLQMERLLDWGKLITTIALVLVYDNINIHTKAGQLRLDEINKQFNGICGFIMWQKWQSGMLKTSSFRIKDVDLGERSPVLFENADDISAYDEILQKRQIELALNTIFFDEVKVNPEYRAYTSKMKAKRLDRKSGSTTDIPSRKRIIMPARTRERLDDETKIERFDPKDKATCCPRPSKQLDIKEEGNFEKEKISLPLIQAEEMSHDGTKVYINHVLKVFLGLEEKDVAGVTISTMGDLGTRRTIASTQVLLAEDKNNMENLKPIWAGMGPIHLAKCLLEIIVKQFHQPNCLDHFWKIIDTHNVQGFNNGRFVEFNRAKDLVKIYCLSYITSHVLNIYSHPKGDATQEEKQLYAAEKMVREGLGSARPRKRAILRRTLSLQTFKQWPNNSPRL